MSNWITAEAFRSAMNELAERGIHSRALIYLSMKYAGVNKADYTEFRSARENRDGFFIPFLKVQDGTTPKYYMLFERSITPGGRSNYAHSSQYSPIKAGREQYIRDWVEWERSSYKARFKDNYEEGLKDVLLKDGREESKIPLAALAIYLQAMEGSVEEVLTDVALASSWKKRLNLDAAEIRTLFDDEPWNGPAVFSTDVFTREDAVDIIISNTAPTVGNSRIGLASSGLGVSISAGDVKLIGLIAEAHDTFTVKAKFRVSIEHLKRYVASLLAKRFVILTGLSGSGKTKIAQAFAQWITPDSLVADPFKAGAVLEGAQSEYTVVYSDQSIVDLINGDGTRVPLPKAIIEEWADYIERHAIPETISGRDLRDKVESESKFAAHLHRLESHYKPAAFALVAARKARESSKCYEVVAVGADWVGSDSVLGYPNGLDADKYVTKPALDLIIQAHKHPTIPHFLILDEMNMSHVERYFSDILSAIESGEGVHLHSDLDRWARDTRIPDSLLLPENLFIIGTVNVDETTYMFSPKVLDRANVLEFRMSPDELKGFLESAGKPILAELSGQGYAAGYGDSLVAHANGSAIVPPEVKESFDEEMLLFFQALQPHGAEFGYRTAYEAGRFMHYFKLLGDQTDDNTVWFKEAFDCIVVQKLLPKLHGSRSKLGPVLKKLWFLCVTNTEARGADALKAAEDAARSTDQRSEPSSPIPTEVLYPLSAEKIGRMWRLLMDNGFASFAEA